MTTRLKTSEFRALMVAVEEKRRLLLEAQYDFDQRVKAMALENAVLALENARCYTAQPADRARERRVVADARYLLFRMREKFRARDRLYSDLAFAGEWK